MGYTELFLGGSAVCEASKLGWVRSCVAQKGIPATHPASTGEMLRAAVVGSDVVKSSQKAMGSSDLVYVEASEGDTARAASELWSVDIMFNNELNEGRDPLYSKSSGMDQIICSYMAERNIGYLINFSNVLGAKGGARARLLGRIRQNVQLCRKYGVKLVLSSCADDVFGLRNPLDLASIGMAVGMSDTESVCAVSKNPNFFWLKAMNRKNPDLITEGLHVKDWGGQKAEAKKRQGWL